MLAVLYCSAFHPIPYGLDVSWPNPTQRLFAEFPNPKIDSMILVLK
jgi:hypothetical protein